METKIKFLMDKKEADELIMIKQRHMNNLNHHHQKKVDIVKISNPRLVEADDDIAIKVRHEKNE